MQTINVLRSRKAVSPMLATLVLVVIAVAAVVVTYAWIMAYMGSAGQQAEMTLDIEDVGWNSATNKTTIVVKNIGASGTRIVRLYIGNTPDNLMDVSADTNLGAGISLPAGSKINVVLNWPNDLTDMWAPSEHYYFRVVPETGKPLEFSSKSPA